MSELLIEVVVLLHLIGAILFLTLRLERLGWRKEYIIPILCVPVFGPLLAITIDLMHVFGRPGSRPLELEALKLEQNVYWNTIEEPQEDPSVVPLEEAILINDKHTRQEAVLSTFSRDAFGYLDVLLRAREDVDTDTTHYATIRITKMHRQFQLALEQCAIQHDKNQQDMLMLDKYLNLLEEYIASPLPDALMLGRQKQTYARLLDKKLALVRNDHDTMLRKLRFSIISKENLANAEALAGQLKQHWPEDERTWIESLRLCVERHDRKALEATLQEMQSAPVSWTREGRATVAPWLLVGENAPA